MALNLTMGRVRQADIGREANSAVADRLLEYFRESGIVLMRPPPRIAHSNNPDTDRAAIASAEEEDRRGRDARRTARAFPADGADRARQACSGRLHHDQHIRGERS